MTKHYCDCCESEITKDNACAGSKMNCDDRLGTSLTSKRTKKTLEIEVITSLDGVWNGGIFCKYCVLDAIKQLDDRKLVRSKSM